MCIFHYKFKFGNGNIGYMHDFGLTEGQYNCFQAIAVHN